MHLYKKGPKSAKILSNVSRRTREGGKTWKNSLREIPEGRYHSIPLAYTVAYRIVLLDLLENS